jgi:hypothetical protein
MTAAVQGTEETLAAASIYCQQSLRRVASRSKSNMKERKCGLIDPMMHMARF